MPTTDGDIVIVGGGPAGVVTAVALVRTAPELADRVVIVEKETYPREKLCAGAIGRRGWAILERLGAVPMVPSVSIEGITVRVGSEEVESRLGGLGYVVRRLEFDHALARIAVGLGVRLREGIKVLGIRRDGRGAVVETTQGEMPAAVVVGADGVGSVVRRVVGVKPEGYRAQVLEVDTEPWAGDRDRGLIHFDVTDRELRGYTWDFPTLVDGRALVCRGIYMLRIGGEVDLGDHLRRKLAGMGIDLASCRNKRFAERGFGSDTTVVEGPIMLVGEAAGIDPLVGEGIAQAIEYGSLAGSFLADVVRDRRPLGDWTALLMRSRLAFDLRIRSALVKLAFGPARADAERWMLECKNLLECGCRHFAAMPIDFPALGEALLHGAWTLGAGGAAREFRRLLATQAG
jgi:menaquinone-9 beta-reductase